MILTKTVNFFFKKSYFFHFLKRKLFSVPKEKYDVVQEKKFSEDRKCVTPKPDAFTYECTGNFSAN